MSFTNRLYYNGLLFWTNQLWTTFVHDHSILKSFFAHRAHAIDQYLFKLLINHIDHANGSAYKSSIRFLSSVDKKKSLTHSTPDNFELGKHQSSPIIWFTKIATKGNAKLFVYWIRSIFLPFKKKWWVNSIFRSNCFRKYIFPACNNLLQWYKINICLVLNRFTKILPTKITIVRNTTVIWNYDINVMI